jgi:hypothetical protein
MTLANNSNLNDLVQFVNDEIKKIVRCYRANRMALNISKTKYVIFHTKGKPVDHNLKLLYDVNEPNQHEPKIINKTTKSP